MRAIPLFSILVVAGFITEIRGGNWEGDSTWKSPDGKMVLAHGPMNRMEADSESLPKTAYVVSRVEGAEVLWAGLSYVDESAHSARGVWSNASDAVVILDRPQRASVNLAVLRITEDGDLRGQVLELDPVVEKTLRETGDEKKTVLVKVWFGDDWKWENNCAIGSIYVARADTHRVRMRVKRVKGKERIEVVSVETTR